MSTYILGILAQAGCEVKGMLIYADLIRNQYVRRVPVAQERDWIVRAYWEVLVSPCLEVIE